MDSARIDTIHGLCASILRANAAEASVDPGFEVLDEIEAECCSTTAIDDLLRALDAGDPVLELFTEYGEREIRATLQTVAAARSARGDLFTDWLRSMGGGRAGRGGRFRAGIDRLRRSTRSVVMRSPKAWDYCRSVI